MVPCINVYDLEGLARRLGAALLLVGDDAQLPPVSAAASGVLATEAMAKQFTSNDRTARLETVMRTGDGAVLQLSRAIRYSPDLRAVWPTKSHTQRLARFVSTSGKTHGSVQPVQRSTPANGLLILITPVF